MTEGANSGTGQRGPMLAAGTLDDPQTSASSAT
jgi:hypothetical protein